jgi:hypothetical protein
VKAVERAVGHASSTTTLNLYVHLWPGDEDRIRQAVDKAVALVASEDSLRTEGRFRVIAARKPQVRPYVRPRFHTLKRISMTSPSATS